MFSTPREPKKILDEELYEDNKLNMDTDFCSPLNKNLEFERHLSQANKKKELTVWQQEHTRKNPAEKSKNRKKTGKEGVLVEKLSKAKTTKKRKRIKPGEPSKKTANKKENKNKTKKEKEKESNL